MPLRTCGRCFMFHLFRRAASQFVDIFITPIVARTEARPLKHLKHETSTKHRCATTMRLQGRDARTIAAHTGLVSTQSSRMNEQSGHRRHGILTSAGFVFVRVGRVVIPIQSRLRSVGQGQGLDLSTVKRFQKLVPGDENCELRGQARGRAMAGRVSRRTLVAGIAAGAER